MTSPPQETPKQPAQQDVVEADDESAELQEAPPEQPQNAWEAARELLEHAPESFTNQGNFFTGGTPSFGGSLVTGDQHTVSGGQVHGDVVTGHKTTIYQIGSAFGTPLHGSGVVPDTELASLAEVFQDGPAFAGALSELRGLRVLVLRGLPDSGRRAAALMLLHRLGARRIRALDPDIAPASLLKGADPADGYLLEDFTAPRSRPLTEMHLFHLHETLTERQAHLVITMADASHRGPRHFRWTPPDPESVLAAHLRVRLGAEDCDRIPGLLALPEVRDFLEKTRPIREIAEFAVPLAAHTGDEPDRERLTAFGQAVVSEQVDRWFGDPQLPLREKAFLLSLAVFDRTPYALTAELSDHLFRRLENIDAPGRKEGIPPFGNSVEDRVALARALLYEENEQTPWGPVPQRMAGFGDPRTPHTLLRETWISHPSARPAVLLWLNGLAVDPRPLVRTRVASAAALLASVDLSSAMGRLLGPWSESKDFRLCLLAANSLVLAYYAGTAAVPRILRDWCQDDNGHRRWSAIRGYALLGHLMPAEALDALALASSRLDEDGLTELVRATLAGERDRPTDHPTQFEAVGLVEAAELLLLSPAGPTVLTALADWTTAAPELRSLALATFLTAAQRTEDGQDGTPGRPTLLDWFAQAPRTGPGAPAPITTVPGPGAEPPVRDLLATLWRTALGDRVYGPAALQVFRAWLTSSRAEPETESLLAELLPALAVTDRDVQRLSHLLRTARDAAGPLAGAPLGRLLSDLAPH
ncbi:hypothetical protein [Kitasatospora sp. MBT63]|uniref:hypothetical protein n=1 Tax=Kitasatospora sp. MBT63 TaxID=1444768 RepID=UPI0011EA6BDB|nr:hypothetical protein [Kitasatospora sp. MBT63]